MPSSDLDPIARSTLTRIVVEQLRGRVESGVWKPGDKLPSERELMAQLGVGRSAIREALQALAMMNLIETQHGRGSYVAGDTNGAVQALLRTARRSEEESIQELLEFRRFLECETAALAARRRTNDDLRRLEQALVETRRTIDDGRPILLSDLAFHRALATAAHNFVLERVYKSTSDLLRHVRTRTAHLRERDEPALAFHTAIYEAVLRQDAVEAARHMAEHLHDFAVTLAGGPKVGDAARNTLLCTASHWDAPS